MSPTLPGSVDVDAGLDVSQSVAPHGVLHHPANQAFAKGIEAVVMKTLGMNLSSITTSDNFPWPAIQIKDYFSDHFGEQAEQPVMPNVPAFLLLPEQRVSPQLIPAAFRYRLSSLELVAPNQACTVVRNLDWLTSSFHLSGTERKVRTYALISAANSDICRRYCVGSNSLADEKTEPPADRQMHPADVYWIFDE